MDLNVRPRELKNEFNFKARDYCRATFCRNVGFMGSKCVEILILRSIFIQICQHFGSLRSKFVRILVFGQNWFFN